jgi:hypothetical protein
MESPLDLLIAQPYTPPANAPVTTMLVPANPVDSHGLVWSDAEARLVWGPVGGSGGGTSDHGALAGLADDDHPIYHTDERGDARYSPLSHGHDYAPTTHDHAIGDVTGLQSALDGKQAAGSYAAASHNHDGTYAPVFGPDDNYVTDAEKAKLANLSGTNTGDQTLPTWSTIAGKPAVVAAGADAAAARTAIGAGTSNLALGTTASTAKAGNYAPPAASATAQGVVELATTAETTTGTDAARAVTPAGVKAVADTKANASHDHTAAQVTGLATVATTGAYADLAGTPTIPDTETIQDVVGGLVVGAGGTYNDAAGTITLPVGGGSVADPQPINAQTTAYTLTASDAGKLVTMTLAAAGDLTVPTGTFTAGQRVDVLDLGASRVTFVAGAGMTLSGTPSLVSRAQHSAHSIIFLSSTEAVVVGDLA